MTSSVLDRLAQVIGLPAAVNLTSSYGGGRLRVPKAVRKTHPLCVAVGVAAARKLCDEFAGEELDIPSERCGLLASRNAQICALYPGKGVKALGRQFRLAPRTIRKILDANGCRKAV